MSDRFRPEWVIDFTGMRIDLHLPVDAARVRLTSEDDADKCAAQLSRWLSIHGLSFGPSVVRPVLPCAGHGPSSLPDVVTELCGWSLPGPRLVHRAEGQDRVLDEGEAEGHAAGRLGPSTRRRRWTRVGGSPALGCSVGAARCPRAADGPRSDDAETGLRDMSARTRPILLPRGARTARSRPLPADGARRAVTPFRTVPARLPCCGPPALPGRRSKRDAPPRSRVPCTRPRLPFSL